MIITTYSNAADFLLKTQPFLEKNEATNNLMLGICLRLKNFPDQIKTAPYLATVVDEHGLVVATVMTPPQKLVVYSDKMKYGNAMELLARDLNQSLDSARRFGAFACCRSICRRIG